MSLLGPNLESFMAIVQSKTVQSAAKLLGITQTGVTQRTRSLESQLQATLFIRSRRGMLLTQEGEALYRYCKTVRDLEGETLAKIRGAGTQAEVRVCIMGPTSIMRTRIIHQTIAVLKLFPNVLSSFEISDERSAADALRSGKCQFAIIPPEEVSGEMDSKLLRPEQYVLVANKKWKFRPLKDIVSTQRIIDFNFSDTTTHDYLKKFKLLSFALSGRHFVNNNEALLEMLNHELGYGVLTKEFAEQYSKHANIAVLNEGQHLDIRHALAWYPRPQMAPYFDAIRKSIH